MLVDGIGREEIGAGLVQRIATFRFQDDRVQDVRITVPAELDGGPADDGTPVLPFAVLLAMRLGEDLELRGPVDRDLLSRVDHIQRYYLAGNPDGLHPVSVRTRGILEPGRPFVRAAGCLSRGVDSLFQSAHRRSPGGALDALLYVDHLEPIHSDPVRAEELELAERAAQQIGLPLIVVDAHIRSLSDTYFDWEDVVGAGLAWVAHSLTGGLGRVAIPSTDHLWSLPPSGHGPALEPLFSSTRMRLEAGAVSETRTEKVAWLAEHAPELLPLLKVCYSADRSDNCGRCAKCLLTMGALRAVGALDRATGFPPALDLSSFAAERHRLLTRLTDLDAIRAAAIRAGDDSLAGAASNSLQESLSGVPGPPGAQASFRARHTLWLRSLLAEGRVSGVGLVQAVSPTDRHHRHGAGAVPEGRVTAELGALADDPGAAQIPLWVLPDGRLATPDLAPRGAAPGLAPRLRHAAANLIRHGAGGWPRGAFADRLTPAAPQDGQAPAGYLFADPAPDRIALWVGEDPINGDQFSASSDREITGAGFPRPQLLGYLLACAPVTGRLGVHDGRAGSR